MTDDQLAALRHRVETEALAEETAALARLTELAALPSDARARITARAADLVREIRASAKPGLMEVFLAEYGLSTDEGIALMCLAEALLRVPDAPTMDALIEDKIAPSDWGQHLGHSSSSLVNASTWGLMLTGKVLEDSRPGVAGTLRGVIKRLGEPVIRTATARAMREMGRQFVLGETIEAAMKRARELEAEGYTYSYDMLGEAARTGPDAGRYFAAYARAIGVIGSGASAGDIRANPGISVKLSALHPRYEMAKRARLEDELLPRARRLAQMAAQAGIGLNIDAEEADRLVPSLDVIEALMADPELAGWDGLGVVVQAYGQRAGTVLDWLHELAERHDRRIMVRLVKGAYWDTEIKRAQVLGLDGFPVFTRKPASDVSYIANARRLLAMRARIYPQFATHNAHSVAAILDMVQDMRVQPEEYEFQRLHGMGERLHEIVRARHGTRCRIYAPVGAHRDLLAYLVRRLLENGANSSFVNQIVDENVPPEKIAACPFAALEQAGPGSNPLIRRGPELFAPERPNSRGWDLTDPVDLAVIEAARAPHRTARFTATPILAGPVEGAESLPVINPARPDDTVGTVTPASTSDVETALAAAAPWQASAGERRAVLARAAELYERDFGPLFAILAREAGKTLLDSVGELREAVDFLHFYGAQAEKLETGPRGTFACISPWNFPLAIFTGQIAGALAAGNAVLAKPAEQTALVAAAAVRLLHEAGVPRTALQLLPGDGATVGAALTSDARVAGVAFTGSTETALMIRRSMAAHLAPEAPLIAETGGLNAMIVDSTALHEQAVRDILASAFQSAGQRCSALRCLYVQRDVAPEFRKMLFDAMDELTLGDPWDLATDTGPVIDRQAARDIRAHIEAARSEGRVVKELSRPGAGYFIAPTVIAVKGIQDLEREVFGPVLHIAEFDARRIDAVIDAVNASGYGLTFGLHSRIDDRVQQVVDRLHVGNIYVNRNQIGAVVGSQPFGGEGLSGTGPKAGGPHYVPRFAAAWPAPETAPDTGAEDTAAASADIATLQAAIDAAQPDDTPVSTTEMPGPTGESNRLSTYRRAPLLCLGPGKAAQDAQRAAVEALGGIALPCGPLSAVALTRLHGFSGVLFWGPEDEARALAQALAGRDGPILPLIATLPDPAHVLLERHLCIDTTAAGGNAALLARVSA
ncbi:bifunctional proline dehydrogenase/L-glutamate gamma-semialdehyde dehydrogenase PutA [Alkalilacustris brevis]|uniref:bifunctional proline dehydrogenase/L-glutamate gamma-semialdehyde dehydrogenase PutA n=1 Tax=Alkalilacustris brevis TaxID=2026338 RepID=UPI000E0D0554|nr:bifunctional proline dehydrogenase/L-glutamate gamma-semialdehyde dehydrogenase PutA [Alkalilacustris brevis]